MYTPSIYAAPDVHAEAEIVRGNPLAVFVTCAGVLPAASHVPMVLPDEVDEISGATLIGHLNRRNPQWTSLRDGDRALAIFHGPHGYVSPSVYGVTPSVPTWNFTSVHLGGRIRKLVDPADTLDVVMRTARVFEARFGRSWDITGSAEYCRQMAPGVGAFLFVVDEVDSTFKLSQEKPAGLRDKVSARFEASETGLHRELAKLMRNSQGGPA